MQIDKYEKKVKDLYSDGVINIQNIFDKDFLLDVQKIKSKLFEEFPYGQDDQLRKKENNVFIRPGSYMIWDLLERESVFFKILENKIIQDLAIRVLGKNYQISTFYIRKTPKTNEILQPHIDYQGGLSFSILLDDIRENQGETVFYKKSHKYPPPPFSNINDLELKKDISSSTGKLGDTFFWFPDCWHGRNINKGNHETTILMCHMGNLSFPNKDATGRTVSYNKKIDKKDKPKESFILNFFFLFTGRSSNNVFKHLAYCLMYFKFSKITNIAIKQKIIFTRYKYGEANIDNFSLSKYLSLIKISKIIKVILGSTLKKVLGKNNFASFRNFFK